MSVVLTILVAVWGLSLVGVLAVWAWSSTGGRADLDIGSEPVPGSSSHPAVPM